ncbi:MAG: GNAT family N-acetyltransferase [Planctomycetes bacterium]|nr:GNAT family N-acetyltransferase [Planctomycetota bacterium]
MNGLIQAVPRSDVDVAARPSSRFQLVTDIGALTSLAPAWQELLARSAHPEPMAGPTWLIPWWRMYGAAKQLRVGLFWMGDRLVGMAPLCARRKTCRLGIPFRRLEFLGSDVDEHDGVCSEYLGVIAEKGFEAEVARTLAADLHSGAFGAWDEVVLSAMDGTAAMPELLLREFEAQGLRAERKQSTSATFVTLPGAWDEYLRSLGKKKRQGLTYALRDFQSWAGPDWQLVHARTPEQLEQGRQILKKLHNDRWQADGKSGAFASPRFDAFHEAVMPALLAEGRLDLIWLCVRGTPVAAHYHIAANGKTYFYQSGRECDVPAKLRLGIVMAALAIKEAIAAGISEFDFLGGEDAYKRQLARESRPIVQIRVARKCAVEKLRRFTEWGAGLLRNVRRRLQARARA